jgi:hypothetical protein
VKNAWVLSIIRSAPIIYRPLLSMLQLAIYGQCSTGDYLSNRVGELGRGEQPGAESVTATSHNVQKDGLVQFLGLGRYLGKTFQDSAGIIEYP